MDRMKELVEILNKYAYQYYVLDEPIVSDKEYDVLYDELVLLERQTGVLLANSPTKRVGGEIISEFLPSVHLKKLYSLDKAQTKIQLQDFVQRLQKKFNKDVELTVEYKFDGLTISLLYDNGVFQKASTRGNGEVGEDVTTQVLTIKSFPLEIDYKGKIEIQGEGIMRWSVFNEYNKKADEPLKNPRNAVAGAIRNMDSSVTASRKLDIMFYNVGFMQDNILKSQSEVIEFLKTNKFKVSPKFIICKGFEEVAKQIDEIERERNDLDFMIDGAVVKVNDYSQRVELGYTEKFPRYAIAFKFEAEEMSTILKKVDWQVGRTGKLTPLAHLEAVELNGATVRKATLNNYGDILRKGVKEGSRVLVRRSNDVIPEILGVIESHQSDKEIELPKVCPSCNGSLIEEGANVFCTNELDCPSQIEGRLCLFASKDAMDIEGFSEKTAKAMISTLDVKNVSDLYGIMPSDLSRLEGFKDKKIVNLINAIEKSKKVSLARFIYALGISNVGKKTAKDLANHFGTFDNFSKATAEQLIEISEVGEIVAKSIVEFFADDKKTSVVKNLFLKGVQIVDSGLQIKSNIFEGQKVVITGTLTNFKRSEAGKIIEENGGEVVSSVTNTTTLVLAGEKAGSKLTEANNKGIKVISEQQFVEMLNN